MEKEKFSDKLKDRIPALIVIALLIAAWQIGAVAVNMPHILPAPSNIVVRIWELRETLFLSSLPATLQTIAIGWGMAIAIGFALASAMYFSETLNAMLYPIMVVTQTIPVMCISPLFVVWMGYTVQARVTAVVLSTFFSIALNTYNGFLSTDKSRIELMKTMGASRSQIFLRLELPSALPGFMTSLKMTFPWAVIDAAVAEWLGATNGLGYFSKRMISRMDGAAVFAPIVILCVLALIGMAIIKYVDKKLIRWRSEI